MSPDSIQSAFMFVAWFVIGGGFSAMLIVFGLFLGFRYLAFSRHRQNHYGIEFGRADLALAIVSVLGGLALLRAVIHALEMYSAVTNG